jgi:phage gp45-like
MPGPNSNYGVAIPHRLAQSIARQQQLIDLINEGIRVCLIGVVQAFDAAAQTVDVVVATNEYITDNPSKTNFSPETDSSQIPVLHGVPVAVLSAGGFCITFPITVGDECLLIFHDTALDVWWQNSGPDKTNLDTSINHNPISQRRHSLSDAIAVFGIRPKARAVSGFSIDSLQIRNEDNSVQIELTDDTINIKASDTINVQAPEVNITGSDNVHIAGGASKHTFLDGKNFWLHTHGGVTAGTGSTGPVIP